VAWFGDRNGRRRRRTVAALTDRNARGGLRSLLSRKIAGEPLLSAVLFVVVVVAVSDLGHIPPNVREGVQLEQDLRARVAFSYPDLKTTNDLRQRARKRTPRIYVELDGWVDDVVYGAERMVRVCAEARNVEEASKLLARQGLKAPVEKVFPEISPLSAEKARKELIEPLRDGIKKFLYDEIVILEQKDYEEEDASDRSNLRRYVIRRRSDGREKRVDIVLGVYSASASGAVSYFRGKVHQILSERPETLRVAVADLIEERMVPNVRLDQEATRAAQETAASEVKEVVEEIARGAVIARRGDTLGQEQVIKAGLESRAFEESRPLRSRLLRLLGVMLSVAVVLVVFVVASAKLSPEGFSSNRRVASFACLALGAVALGRVLALFGAPLLLSPACYVAMVAGLLFPAVMAVMGAAAVSVLIGIVARADFSLLMAISSGPVVAALLVSTAKRPADILRAGALAGLAQFVANVGMDLGGGIENVGLVMNHGGWGLLSGIGSGLLVVASLSAMEFLGITTQIGLLELTDQNQPVLRQLILRAPGTYHHSFIVGSLCEAAAEAIGANQLLARTAAYYHDIGKLTKPEYFTENQPPGRSRHDRLTPAMSTLIITSHVKDGVDLAREYRLPRVIRDIIEQHHGTSRVEYFYRQALEAAGGGPVDDEAFRYPGPRPRTRESGVVLIADTVEAASRSLEDPSPARIQSLVHDLIMDKLLDNQFDDCGLTLKDLKTIERTFVRVLTTMFHRRVRYPSKAGGEEGRGEVAANGEPGDAQPNGAPNGPGPQASQDGQEGEP